MIPNRYRKRYKEDKMLSKDELIEKSKMFEDEATVRQANNLYDSYTGVLNDFLANSLDLRKVRLSREAVKTLFLMNNYASNIHVFDVVQKEVIQRFLS